VSTIRQPIDNQVFETSDVAAESGRGRTAERPTDIPARGWLDVSWRAAKRFSDDNVTLIAGGLAMYALLSVFPALAATVSIYGMFATPSDVIDQMTAFAGVLPPGVWDIFSAELQSITRTGQTTLTFAAALGIVVALWSARAAMSSLMTATNIAYRERETRGFIRTTLLSLAFTAGAVLGFLLMLTLGVVIPVALAAFGSADWTKAAVGILRMALLWAIMVAGFAIVYRYAPAREHARWRWVSPGSMVAATLWLAASAVFAFYVTNFAGYAKTYGALGGVVVLLMWFFISSIVVVLGAQINAELERQTVKDTTDCGGAPLGERGAYAADTVGPPLSAGKPATANENVSAHARAHPVNRESRISAERSVERGTQPNPTAYRPKRSTNVDFEDPRDLFNVASDTNALLKRAGKVADPSASTVGRIAASVSAVRLTLRLLPAGVRLIRRYPLGSSVAIAVAILAVVNASLQTRTQNWRRY